MDHIEIDYYLMGLSIQEREYNHMLDSEHLTTDEKYKIKEEIEEIHRLMDYAIDAFFENPNKFLFPTGPIFIEPYKPLNFALSNDLTTSSPSRLKIIFKIFRVPDHLIEEWVGDLLELASKLRQDGKSNIEIAVTITIQVLCILFYHVFTTLIRRR